MDDAFKFLLYFFIIFFFLYFVWYFTGGPQKEDSKKAFISIPQSYDEKVSPYGKINVLEKLEGQ
jgi:hypothetical protein